MKILYFLPFTYFANTRLLKGSIAFHALFEWIAAIFLVSLFGIYGLLDTIQFSFGAYIAFISLYEIGYLINDLVSAKKESSPRLRGPQDASMIWVVAWAASRLVVFALLTLVLNMQDNAEWWLFFLSMLLVFWAHNSLKSNEAKASTFLWLAWFRFLAPVIFVVQAPQRMGIAFGAAALYAGFRLFGYLDSKGLLNMPRRQSMEFRAMYFVIPLSAVLATLTYYEAAGFRAMAMYYCLIATAAYIKHRMVGNNISEMQ